MQMPMRPPPQMVVPAQPLYMAPAPPQMAPAPFGVMPAMAPPEMPMEEPPSKRARGEDNLMPEADFLARNVSPVTFRILVPSASDKPEWKLNGQMLAVTLPLSDSISAMKRPACHPASKSCRWKTSFSRIPTLWPFTIFTQILLFIYRSKKEAVGKNKP